MLKGISPYLSPELLKTLCEMGHADEILLADAHFPGHTLGRRVVRADGLNVSQLLDAILPLFCLESTEDALVMMKRDGGDDEQRCGGGFFWRRCGDIRRGQLRRRGWRGGIFPSVRSLRIAW